MLVTRNRPLIVCVLLLAATVCLLVAWCITAGVLIDGTNPSAWGYAGLTFGFAGFLVASIPVGQP